MSATIASSAIIGSMVALAKPVRGMELPLIPARETSFRLQKVDMDTGDVFMDIRGRLLTIGVSPGSPLYFLSEYADTAFMAPEQAQSSYDFRSSEVQHIVECAPGNYLICTRNSVYRLLRMSNEECETEEENG